MPVQGFHVVFLVFLVDFPLALLVGCELTGLCYYLPNSSDEKSVADDDAGDEDAHVGGLNGIFGSDVAETHHGQSLDRPVERVIDPNPPVVEKLDYVGVVICC